MVAEATVRCATKKGVLMKSIVVAALCLAFATASCAHVGATVENCARKVTPDLIKAVATDLATDNYDDALKAVEASVGLCVLKVAVQDAENAASADSSALAAHDPTATAIVAHAQAWLAAHGGPPVVTSTIKAGLPGGGTGGSGWCCFHAGGGLWHVGEFATDGTVVTATNMAGLCASGRLPVRQVCR